MIAHRLSTIKHAHRIFVLEKGELIEQGIHKELIEMNGVYSRLVQTQMLAEQKGLISDEKLGEEIKAAS